jgi:hypothetical protein
MLAGMERSRSTALWTVTYFADDLGCQVMRNNRCRVVGNLEWEGEHPGSRQLLLQEAREKAVEIALEHRIPLTDVYEASSRYWPDGAPPRQ